MELWQFEEEFAKLGENYKTCDVDKFNRRLIKGQEDVSFLADIVLEKQQYHRTFFQVSLGKLSTLQEKLAFIEAHFDKLRDWWHVDQLSQFVDKLLTFDYAYEKAKVYIKSDMPFVRRWGYVLFIQHIKVGDFGKKSPTLLRVFISNLKKYIVNPAYNTHISSAHLSLFLKM